MSVRRGWSIDWKELGAAFVEQVRSDRVFNGAAALAFYLLLAIFPGMVFLLTLLPYLPIPDLRSAVMDLIGQTLPAAASELLTGTVDRVVSHQSGGLLSVSILGAIWAASTGMHAAMQQLNIAAGVDESRPFVRARVIALLLTFLFGALVIVAFGLVVAGGHLQSFAADRLGWSDALRVAFGVFRWIVIVIALLTAFAAAYHLAPNVDQKLRRVLPGAVLGSTVLVLASVGFRIYVGNFGNYGALYGGLGAVIVLILWLYIAALVLILGSELNVALEAQSPHGKKRGERKPQRPSRPSS